MATRHSGTHLSVGFMLLSILAGAGDHYATLPYGALWVTVTASRGMPVSNARVTTSTVGWERQLRTDAVGKVQLCLVPAESIAVRVTANGYLPATSTVVVAPDSTALLSLTLAIDTTVPAQHRHVASVVELGPGSAAGCP